VTLYSYSYQQERLRIWSAVVEHLPVCAKRDRIACSLTIIVLKEHISNALF